MVVVFVVVVPGVPGVIAGAGAPIIGGGLGAGVEVVSSVVVEVTCGGGGLLHPASNANAPPAVTPIKID